MMNSATLANKSKRSLSTFTALNAFLIVGHLIATIIILVQHSSENCMSSFKTEH